MTDQDAMALLKRLFCSTDVETTNVIRMHRLEALYELGKAARGGCIVELGTYYGAGATAMWFGTQRGYACDVYTIDDYLPHTGPAGETYGIEDYYTFSALLQSSGAMFCHFFKSFRAAAKMWTKPVALLYWDGIEDTLASDVFAWARHIIIGGTVAIHDHIDQFHTQEFIKYFEGNGKWKRGLEYHDGGIYAVVRQA